MIFVPIQYLIVMRFDDVSFLYHWKNWIVLVGPKKVIFVVVTSYHIAIALVSATCSQPQIKKRKKKQDIHGTVPHFGPAYVRWNENWFKIWQKYVHHQNMFSLAGQLQARMKIGQ